ncbi:MAG: fasciclin domain-containing protein [Cyanobacteria bacterium P01_F01_bin.150]
MKLMLQKTGLVILVLSLSGMANITPTIAKTIDSYKDINPDISLENTDKITEPIDTNVVSNELTDTTNSDAEFLTEEDTETVEAAEHSTEAETIVDVATSSETFTTLVSALSETELVDVLQGDGPFTVFAPTDEAFEALPAGTLEALMAPENREVLVSLLAYHVVPAELSVEQLETGALDSVQGAPLQVEVGDEVTVNGVTIIEDEIPASNGVIHTIDQVILPPQ